jgi:hypothetical protein
LSQFILSPTARASAFVITSITSHSLSGPHCTSTSASPGGVA